jgi:hypothetical protein
LKSPRWRKTNPHVMRVIDEPYQPRPFVNPHSLHPGPLRAERAGHGETGRDGTRPAYNTSMSREPSPGRLARFHSRKTIVLVRLASAPPAARLGSTPLETSCIPGLTICSCNPWLSGRACYSKTFRLSVSSRLAAELSRTKCHSGSYAHLPKDLAPVPGHLGPKPFIS